MSNNKDYRHFYIKYKIKYLKLKNKILGGASATAEDQITQFYDPRLAAEKFTLKINNFNLPNQNLLTVEVNKAWEEITIPLRQKGFTHLYYNSNDSTDNILEYSTDDFNVYYGSSSVVILYSLPIKGLLAKSYSKKNKEKAFKIFAKEQLTQRKKQKTIELKGNFEKINSKELIKNLEISKHAKERDEERSKRVTSAIGDLNNRDSIKLGILAIYTPIGESPVERYILITSQNVYVLSSNKNVIITLWPTEPSFNDWYKTFKQDKTLEEDKPLKKDKSLKKDKPLKKDKTLKKDSRKKSSKSG